MKTPVPSPDPKYLGVLTGVTTMAFIAAVYAADPRSRTSQEITEEESRRVADIIQAPSLPQPQSQALESTRRRLGLPPVHSAELPRPKHTPHSESKAAAAKTL